MHRYIRSLSVGCAGTAFMFTAMVATCTAATAPDAALVLQIEQADTAAGPWTALGKVVPPVGSDSGVVRLRIEGGSVFRPPAGYVWIPPGQFLMGTPTNEVSRRGAEGPQTRVRISQGFWMSKYEVTQAEYEAVMGANGSFFVGPELPVDQVSWDEAMEYCTKLNAREQAAGRLPAGLTYRLPTEAEWEYACRAGTTNASAFGSELSSTQANFDGTKPYNGGAVGPNLGLTVKVGSYPANDWGLHDMHGNVSEWVMDWSTGALPGGRMTDLVAPSVAGVTLVRMHRGGAWHSEGQQCRSGSRTTVTRVLRVISSGFRPVLSPLSP